MKFSMQLFISRGDAKGFCGEWSCVVNIFWSPRDAITFMTEWLRGKMCKYLSRFIIFIALCSDPAMSLGCELYSSGEGGRGVNKINSARVGTLRGWGVISIVLLPLFAQQINSSELWNGNISISLQKYLYVSSEYWKEIYISITFRKPNVMYLFVLFYVTLHLLRRKRLL